MKSTRTSDPLLYEDWMLALARRFDDKLATIWTEHNFELGPEFEIAICDVLREVLPERAGVCRGYVEEQSGRRAGDDIIVYDAARFPTLRSLGRDLWRKERVPAEAVLAYIEAKHTLYVGKHRRKAGGQSLTKALRQVADVKSIKRAPVPLSQIGPRMAAGTTLAVARRPGFPSIRNPWYAAIWTRELVLEDAAWSTDRLAAEVFGQKQLDRLKFPDVVASRQVFVAPAYEEPVTDVAALRPFIRAQDTCQLLTRHVADGLGMAMAIIHLTWALEELLLGEIPWAGMLHQALRRSGEEQLLSPQEGYESGEPMKEGGAG